MNDKDNEINENNNSKFGTVEQYLLQEKRL